MKSIRLPIIFIFLLSLDISFTKAESPFLQKIQMAKPADSCKDLTFSPTKDNVKLIGRFYQKEDITWIVQSGSSIEFYATGLSSEVVLVGGSSIYNDPNYRTRFGVYVDDKNILDTTMDEEELPVELFKGSSEKKVKVRVMLLSEANNGGIGIKTITINSCNERPIIPTEKKELSIEFIGDSITAAYGVEGANQYENFKTTTENFSKSYAYLTAKKMDADYSAVCYSGHGIVSGYSQGEKNSEAFSSRSLYKN